MALDEGQSGKKVVKAAVSITPDDQLKLLEMEEACLKLGMKVTLSQIFRAALNLLHEVNEPDRIKLISAVPTFAPGPAKGAPRQWCGVRRPRVPGLPKAEGA